MYVGLYTAFYVMQDNNMNYVFRAVDTFEVFVYTCVTGGGDQPDVYVMSNAALRRMVTICMQNVSQCPQDESGQNLSILMCLQLCGIRRGSTKDASGLEMFHAVSAQRFIIPQWQINSDKQRWSPFQHYPLKCGKGHSQCSGKSVLFTGITADLIAVFEYFIYRVALAASSCVVTVVENTTSGTIR